MTYRIRPIHIVQTIVGALLLLALSAVAILASGCRSNGHSVSLTSCRDCTVDLTGDARAAQGKSVSGEVSPAVSASVTAQADGNALSQQGDATASPTGDNAASADSQATADKATPATATPKPTAAPATDHKPPATTPSSPQPSSSGE